MPRFVDCLTNTYNAALLALALSVCVASCVSAIAMLSRRDELGESRLPWIGAASVCFGCGIWVTHFVAIMANIGTMPVTYNVPVMAVSAMIAVAGSGLAFMIAHQTPAGALAGGPILGVTIAGMHFVGVDSMHMPASISYDPKLVTFALALGCALATAALAVWRRRQGRIGWRSRAAVASLLTLAVCGVHFSAMAAAEISLTTVQTLPAFGMADSHLDASVAAVTSFVLMLGVFAALIKRRSDAESARVRQLGAATMEGILIHRNGIVLAANGVFCRLAGVREDAVTGMRADDFVGGASREAADCFRTGRPFGPSRVTIRGADGTTTETEVLARLIQWVDGPATVVSVRDLTERLQADERLRQLNLQFDAALNSMAQGMIVWGPDQRVQLLNDRFFTVTGVPRGCVAPDMTIAEVATSLSNNGMFPEFDVATLADRISRDVLGRQSMQHEIVPRDNLLLAVASEPMANGGAVITFEDITAKRRSEEELAFLARHDALTGLANRILLHERVDKVIDRLDETERYAVLYVDLDRFKFVNDTLGHSAGDELLRQVAARLRKCVRTLDIVARLGGDEFAIAMVIPSEDTATPERTATRIIESVSAPYEVLGHTVSVGTCVGIALSEGGISAAEVLKRADVALSAAKQDRGTFAFYASGMDETLRNRRGLEADLRLAVQRGEFELHYQPLYNLAEERVTSFEALVRWTSPTRGRVMPSDFIPIAEETGLIIPIGEWVLRTACAEATKWPDHVRVAVNVSPVQFKDKHLTDIIASALAKSGLAPTRLEVEITETVLLHDSEGVMDVLDALHALGARISMDDFGTGYSSLSYLRRFPFDKIKIDRSFVNYLAVSADASSQSVRDGAEPRQQKSAGLIVRAIAGLGANLGISTTAEGVETVDQLLQLRREGCTEIQGYFISPPRPASELAALMRRINASVPLLMADNRKQAA